MAVDPERREALQLGETPQERGPAFFTTLEALEAYCDEADLQHLESYEVPASVIARGAGQPLWLDGARSTVEEAARRLAEQRRRATG